MISIPPQIFGITGIFKFIMKVDYVLDFFQVCVSEEDALGSHPVLFDVQKILFQVAKAAACQGVGEVSSSSAVPCAHLWARFHLERTCCSSLELGSWIPKKQIAQQHIHLVLALLCPATKGWAVPVCDSVAAGARTASYRPCLCRTVTASITNHLFLHSQSTQSSPHQELESPSCVCLETNLVFSGWSCHYCYFSAHISLFLQLSSLFLATHKGLF